MKFFVYGTLKRGFHNARFIPDQYIQSIVPAEVQGFDMYSTGGFPAIIPGQGTVQGQLITLTDDAPEQEILRNVDRLEGEGHMYRRETHTVAIKNSSVQAEAFVYIWLYSVKGLEKVPDNMWQQ